MNKSIQHFAEFRIKKLEEVRENFINNPKDMAAFIYGIRNEMISFAMDIVKETLENCNQCLRESGKRKQDWQVVRTDPRRLLTSLGEIEFQRTYFLNKHTGERSYLLDRILGLEKKVRMTEDAEAQMLEEAVQTSYRKAGEEASLTETVSKQGVMDKLHSLTFPEGEKPTDKKQVEYLYIDADEDHVSLQFQEKKGDLETGENNWKNNCVLTKLVYVYEGVEPEAPRSKRHRLVNPHYFSGVYEGDDNAKLWDEVYSYLDSHYDLEKVKKVYLNADGGGWIKAGVKRIAGLEYVLDEFHMQKYLMKMVSHMRDSADDARKELNEAIKEGKKDAFREAVEKLCACAETETAQKRIRESGDYILSNWKAARTRLVCRETIRGCSAEGHVSHVLSTRMSSRPMGWSRQGADRMAHLRAYYWNGGDMLELVRGQRKGLPMAAGAEDEVLSCESLLSWERNHQNEVGKYVDRINHSVGTEARNWVGFNAHIWEIQ